MVLLFNSPSPLGWHHPYSEWVLSSLLNPSGNIPIGTKRYISVRLTIKIIITLSSDSFSWTNKQYRSKVFCSGYRGVTNAWPEFATRGRQGWRKRVTASAEPCVGTSKGCMAFPDDKSRAHTHLPAPLYRSTAFKKRTRTERRLWEFLGDTEVRRGAIASHIRADKALIHRNRINS